MIVLDENILEGQRLLLERRGIAARQIGVEIGRKGMKDDEIIVLLRRGRNTTFFTRDVGFYEGSRACIAGKHRLHGCSNREEVKWTP